MVRLTSERAVVLLLGAVLLAGCSNHSGLRRLRPTGDAPSSAPVAIAAPPSSSATSSSKPRASRSRPLPSPSSSATSAGAAGARAVHGTRHRRAGSSTSVPTARPTPGARPPAGPAVGADPSRGVHNAQMVNVSGRRFAKGERVTVRECRAKSTGTCFFWSSTIDVAADGTFATSVLVSSDVGGACGTANCVIAVRRANGAIVTAPISFV